MQIDDYLPKFKLVNHNYFGNVSELEDMCSWLFQLPWLGGLGEVGGREGVGGGDHERKLHRVEKSLKLSS